MTKLHKLFHSLQFQLILWSVLSLLLLAIGAGGYGFWYSYNELNDFQDDSLKSMSALLEQTLDVKAADSTTLLEPNIHFDTDDDDGSITVDVINTAISSPLISSPLVYNSSLDNNGDNSKHDNDDTNHHNDENFNDLTLEDLHAIAEGLSTQTIDDKVWRVYRSNDADRVVIVRQRTEFQDDLARSSALQSFLPLIIGMAFLILLLPFIMWRMMKPVRQLQKEIEERRENDLDPLPVSNLPSELLPLAESLNRLLALVKVSIERQQRFIADAAHELRSPLTAISLQLQRLQRIATDSVMSEGLDKLAIRLKRNQSLVEQLLTLARSGNINTALGAEDTLTSVKFIIEQVIGLLIPIADNKNIELTVDLQSNRKINMDETSLLVLVKNLIQNAIVYTPANGQVIVKLFQLEQNSGSIQKSGLDAQYNFGSQVIHSGKLNDSSKTLSSRLILQIIDSGAGIHPSDYKTVFDPFVRLNQVNNKADQLSNSMSNNTSDSRSDSTSNTSQEIQGTGLGLSIVKSICEQAGIDVFMNDSTATIPSQNNNKGLCITLVF
ncbi:ATP-binding protein [Psychrobacter sp. DAB_AL62B]|uniref:ATP-binding protein n=1 Tax=Psychrobacter sp. DAB_AL62B TaxID=1028420 RepID=UPI002380FB91|nr:ATP-binding protein [Psychrobacter sp. DAB_AL62B]MDE4453956.1 HAMP domain-containing protein [Psychrobacter sp. DAB_AL62B]